MVFLIVFLFCYSRGAVRRPQEENSPGFPFSSDDGQRSKSRVDKTAYQQELARQVAEKQQQKQKEKEAKER